MHDTNDIKFGTDGWRAVIADTYTFENVKVLAQATADFIGPGTKVAVGYDTRFMSGRFAAAAADVLGANGIAVSLSDRAVPTPMLSFTVKNRGFDLGVMITASHNPAEYNGFKIKTSSGGAAAPELTKEVEKLVGVNPVKENGAPGAAHTGAPANPVRPGAAHTGAPANPVRPGAVTIGDFSKDYVKFLRSYIDFKKIKTKKFRIIVDSMYGAGDSFIAEVLKGTSIKVEFLHNTVNPSFGGIPPEPIERNLGELKRRMKEGRFNLGIALDGDADRVAAFAPGGIFIHPQKILGLLALHLGRDRGWSGGIVKTTAGTTMIDKIARDMGVELHETPVGFKYISNLMETKDIVAGGEEAGGMGVKNYIPERDGTLAGLLLLEMMAYHNKDMLKILNEVEKKYGRYYYVRSDLKISAAAKLGRSDMPGELLGRKVVEVKDHDGIKMICDDESWLMLRASGTEPIIRIYAESRSLAHSNRLLDVARRIIENRRGSGA